MDLKAPWIEATATPQTQFLIAILVKVKLEIILKIPIKYKQKNCINQRWLLRNS